MYGTPDYSFGTNGIQLTQLDPGSDEGHAVAVQSDGKIVLGGYGSAGVDSDFALVRYERFTTPENSTPPSISGTPTLGSLLTCNPGTWLNNPTFTFAWERDGTTIPLMTTSRGISSTAAQFAIPL